jgi:hypothetical protein
MLEYALEVGREGCYLRLTPEQYRALNPEVMRRHDTYFPRLWFVVSLRT